MASKKERSKPASMEMPGGDMAAGGNGSGMPGGGMHGGMLAAEMPEGENGSESSASGGMPSGGMSGPAGGGDGDPAEYVLVEMRIPAGERARGGMQVPGLIIDPDYEPVPVPPVGSMPGLESVLGGEVVVIRARLSGDIEDIKRQQGVVGVWKDTRIAPFSVVLSDAEVALRQDTPVSLEEGLKPQIVEGLATCPIGTCDCTPGAPKGTMADVRAYLGVDQIHAAGHRGDGIVVGVVDGGITALGRTPKQGETARIGNVIGGFPADWGTTAAAWGDHGNMCATDVLGMAPNARIYDLRISDGAFISAALACYNWAITRHRSDGTPHILSNSFGIFQENWDPAYARDPNHPFTRKVVEAIDEGIIVLFAAGNCGATCPDGRCGPDAGPGRSIWGANSHPRVITVGAVNRAEQFVGYSSQGPGALDANKPDFCSITHFTGYFTSDSGTSAATPICAGVAALLKQAKPALRQDDVKAAFRTTAKDIGPAGFDQHSGAGIIRGKAAYDTVARPSVWQGWESLGGFCTDGVGVSSWADNRLDCFVVGNDRSLYHKWWDGSAWRGYENLGGNIYSNPAAVSWAANRIDVFALGGDHAMWHRWWDGSAWRGWESLGGFCTDGVGVSSWAPNRLDCFVVGNDRALYHKWWDGSTWRGWENLGGNIYSNPAAVSWGPNRIDVFAIGGDHAMWHRWWDGSAWRGWESLGGFCTDGVGVSSWAANRLDCFVVGNDRSLYHKWWDGSAWRGYENLGGNIYSNPAAVSWGPNRIDTFAIGGDHAMWHRWFG